MEHLTEDAIKHHVKVYIRVFAALLCLTALTVGVSYFHLPILYAIMVALAIAVFKGSLVAGFFMHLMSEKKVIFVILMFAFLFFFALLLLPIFSKF